MARLMTLPLNTDWTELMKLDFPEPTGPTRRTRAASVQLGLYELMLFTRVVLCLHQSASIMPPLTLLNMTMHIFKEKLTPLSTSHFSTETARVLQPKSEVKLL